MGRVFAPVGAAVAGVSVLLGFLVISLVGVVTGGGDSFAEDLPVACTVTLDPTGSAGSASVAGTSLDAEQTGNAITVVAVAKGAQMSPRDAAVGVMTAMQESSLRNLTHGDAAGPDSRGLFQQRPRFYPGVDVSDPPAAAAAFFDRLRALPARGALPMWQAAQAVQRSADGSRYRRWERFGTALAQALWSGTSASGVSCTSGPPAPSPPASGVPDLEPTGDAVIDAARAWALAQLGTPYEFGGSCTDPHGPNPAGRCDCSSLMQQAYAHAGIRIPRTTLEQVHVGREVAVGDLQAGDLVFIAGSLGTTSSPRHVGMYLGEGWLIQAPSSGDVVKLARLADWQPEIAAARRVLT